MVASKNHHICKWIHQTIKHSYFFFYSSIPSSFFHCGQSKFYFSFYNIYEIIFFVVVCLLDEDKLNFYWRSMDLCIFCVHKTYWSSYSTDMLSISNRCDDMCNYLYLDHVYSAILLLDYPRLIGHSDKRYNLESLPNRTNIEDIYRYLYHSFASVAFQFTVYITRMQRPQLNKNNFIDGKRIAK